MIKIILSTFFVLIFIVMFYYSFRQARFITNEEENKKKYLEEIVSYFLKQNKGVIFNRFLNSSEELKSPLFKGNYGLIPGFFETYNKYFYTITICNNYEEGVFEKYYVRYKQSVFTKNKIIISDSEIKEEEQLEIKKQDFL